MNNALTKAAIFLSVAFLMTACGGKTPPPQPYNPAAEAASQADLFVAEQSKKHMKKVNKVAITACNVLFAQTTSASASTGAGLFDNSNRAEARVSVVYTLEGLNGSQMQAIADRFCQRAEAKLADAGYQVVPHKQMLEHEAFKKLQQAGKPSPYEFKVGPATYQVYSRSGGSIFDERYIGTASGLGQAFSAMGGNAAWQQEAVSLEQAGVTGVNINLLLDFAALQSSGDGRGIASQNSAEVTSRVELSVSGELKFKPHDELDCWNRFGKRECMVNASKQPKFHTYRPVNIDDRFYKSIENATTTGDKVTAGVTKALSMLGGGSSVDVTRYKVTVDPARFEAAAQKAVDGMIAMSLAKAAQK